MPLLFIVLEILYGMDYNEIHAFYAFYSMDGEFPEKRRTTMRIRKIIGMFAAGMLSLSLLAGCGSTKEEDTKEQKPQTEKQETADTETKEKIMAEIKVKDYGTITVALEPEYAPITVENFVKLAKDGFYDGLTFHRIMEGFMMQGGDPNGDGTGGAEETIKGEFSENGVDNPLSHTRGAISMARSQMPDSASSQFFIVHEDSPHLDGQYAAFGYVTEGMDVVDKICTEATGQDRNGVLPAENQPVIESITIQE